MRCIEDVTESADVGRSKAAVVGFEVKGGDFSTCVALGSTAGRHGHQNHSTHIGRRKKNTGMSGAPWTFARPSFSCDPLRRCRRSLRAAKNWPPVMRSPWAYGLKSCKTYGSKRAQKTQHTMSRERGSIVSASENADPSRQRAHLGDVRNAHVLVPPAHPRPRLTHPDQTSFQLLVPHHDTFATVSVSGPGAVEFENVVERVDVHGVFYV